MVTPIQERQAEERRERVETILAATRDELRKSGIENLTLAAVAKRARLSKSLLYFYFKNKTDLLIALSNSVKTRLLADFQAARHETADGIQELRRIGEAFITLPHRRPADWDVMALTECILVDPDDATKHDERSIELGRQLVAIVAGAVERGRQDGSIQTTPESPPQVAVLLWAFIYGYNRLMQTRGDAIAHILGINLEHMRHSALQHIAMPLIAPAGQREDLDSSVENLYQRGGVPELFQGLFESAQKSRL